MATLALDKMRLDDPVGAVPVHGVCGIWGTLAVGIFSAEFSIITQLIGTFSIIAFTMVVSFILITIIQSTIGLRVTEEEEIKGLSVAEHGVSGYPDFVDSQTDYGTVPAGSK